MNEKQSKPACEGVCTVAVRFRHRAEYLKWKTYVEPNRKWDFEVSYPAIMRMEFPFKDSLDVEMLTKRIVSLLEMGFDVYSAQWKLSQKKQPL